MCDIYQTNRNYEKLKFAKCRFNYYWAIANSIGTHMRLLLINVLATSCKSIKSLHSLPNFKYTHQLDIND